MRMWIRWMGNDLQMYTLLEWHRTSKSTCSRIFNVPCKLFHLFSFFFLLRHLMTRMYSNNYYLHFFSHTCVQCPIHSSTHRLCSALALHSFRNFKNIFFFRLPDWTIKKNSPLCNLAEWPSTRAKKCVFNISRQIAFEVLTSRSCEKRRKNPLPKTWFHCLDKCSVHINYPSLVPVQCVYNVAYDK